jgi:hypothetical protein
VVRWVAGGFYDGIRARDDFVSPNDNRSERALACAKSLAGLFNGKSHEFCVVGAHGYPPQRFILQQEPGLSQIDLAQGEPQGALIILMLSNV